MEKFKEEKTATSNPNLVNWNPTKGNPFDYSVETPEEKFDMPVITVMDWDEDTDIDNLLPEVITTARFNLSLKTISETIKNPHQAQLLQANEQDGHEKEKYISGREMINDGVSIRVKRSEVKPVKVYIDYPFNKVAEITINPYMRNEIPCMDFGYIIWQVSRAYAEIYKKRWKEFGVWGHGFEDLYLEIMEIRKNNVITLFIGS